MPNGRRYRATAADQQGVMIFTAYGWDHPTVGGLLDASIAREEAALVASPANAFGLGNLPALPMGDPAA
jgi:hypothetical protein